MLGGRVGVVLCGVIGVVGWAWGGCLGVLVVWLEWVGGGEWGRVVVMSRVVALRRGGVRAVGGSGV